MANDSIQGVPGSGDHVGNPVTGSGPTPPVDRWAVPWWSRPPALASAWLTLVVYGSLMPFDFVLDEAVAEHGGLLKAVGAALVSPGMTFGGSSTSPLGIPEWMSDLLINSLLYVPLGVLLMLSLRHRARRLAESARRWPRDQRGAWMAFQRALVARAWRRWALVCLFVIGVSWCLESMQSFSPHRVSSLVDVMTNAIPAVLAAAGTPWAMRRLGRLTFAAYVRGAGGVFACRQVAWWIRRNRGVLLGLGLVLGLAALGWAFLAVGWGIEASVAPAATAEGGEASAAVRLPLVSYFDLPYDEALWRLGVWTAAFGLAGLAAACFVKRRSLAGKAGMALILVSVATTLAPLSAIWRGGAADLTWPILGLAGAGGVFAALSWAVQSVRRRCRRRDSRPVTEDRRKQRHDYGFALRGPG